MFSKKKERPRRSQGGGLAQYGLFDISPEVDLEGDAEDGGDSDLEAELAALTSGGGTKPKRPARKKVPEVNLDAMVQESMRDIGTDEEVSGDDDDPDLLSELNEITGENEEVEASPTKETPPSDIKTLLMERLKMYETAEANAKAGGETSRARRFNRGTKTIKDLLKQANAGKSINNDDIPPEVTINVQKREPQPEEAQVIRPAPPVPTPVNDTSTDAENLSDDKLKLIEMLKNRKELYKIAALKAKQTGNMTGAVNHVKIVKQFELVISAVENGQEVDLSRMPGPPIAEEGPRRQENEVQNEPDQPTIEAQPEAEPEPEREPQEVKLITASTVGEALQQRLDVYKQQEAVAKEEGNSSKARRMGRIIKQFEQAIKLNNQGKPIPAEDLPTPPGFGPIPGYARPATPPESTESPPTQVGRSQPVHPPEPTIEESSKPSPPKVPARSGNHAPTTRMEKQLTFLKMRQKEFKEAALAAKKKGELAEAKEFLRASKGFDPLIEAAQGGLPVDIASLPIPPSAKSHLDIEYDLVMADECTEDDTGVLDAITRLETQLTKQLKMCLTTRDHHKAIGDVAGMNRFEHLALSVTKDLDLVRISKRTNGQAVPKFHYESKDFNIVKSFTDLNDNDLQLSIVRGVNYSCANPKEIDTYVKFEFPYPQEEPVKDKTSTIKDTNNPEYNADFTIPISRKARPCLRVFKRHAVKFEVYSKGGFFRGDTLLGSVTVKLQPLETQCELHDSFDLMDGRKKVGGKLEIRMRVRDPLVTKEVQRLSERWLVIDH